MKHPPQDSHRPLIFGREGMVASGHPLASWIAATVLRDGGNAIDAMVAAGAAMGVLRPQMSGLGGDALTLIYLGQERRLVALEGIGTAPCSSLAFFRSKGMAQVPEHGILAATVPGAVKAWAAALERYGTRPLSTLLAPAIALAEEGFPVSKKLATDIADHTSLLATSPHSRAILLPKGSPLRYGERLTQKDLAQSLKILAQGGEGAFYQGEIAAAVGEFCKGHGGLLSREDFAAYEVRWVEPIRGTYRGYEIYNFPPPSQGIALLMVLHMLEGFDPHEFSWVDWLHLQIEAKKLAFADRDQFVGDPDRMKLPVEQLLSPQYAASRLALIDLKRASRRVQPGDPWLFGGETTYLAVADREGNLVSHLQSVFTNFGSGVVAGRTGMLLNNRLSAFSLEAGVNQLEPGRRPLHTLNPVLLFKGGQPFLAFGTPGAHGQVQILLQALSYLLDYSFGLQEAIEAPRWRHEPGKGLLVEERIPPAIRRILGRRGHRILLRPAWAQEMGGAQGILVDPETGFYLGAADPRREGYAIGW
ncbi:MAG: gamma-glutamyltransferase [Candidatus Methylomirabilales bacterium]